MGKQTAFKKLSKAIYVFLATLSTIIILLSSGVIYIINNPDLLLAKQNKQILEAVNSEEAPDVIENGVHLQTGLLDGKGLMTVVRNCTGCHSAKLITQNCMTRERWVETIRWMQKTQNLPDLGNNEDIILDYLEKHYPVKDKGRRECLTNIAWYELKD